MISLLCFLLLFLWKEYVFSGYLKHFLLVFALCSWQSHAQVCVCVFVHVHMWMCKQTSGCFWYLLSLVLSNLFRTMISCQSYFLKHISNFSSSISSSRIPIMHLLEHLIFATDLWFFLCFLLFFLLAFIFCLI